MKGTTPTGETAGWVHGRRDQRDHPPVPVDARSIQIKERCDFCDVESVSDVIRSKPFLMAPQLTSVGPWMACAVCAAFVRRSRWIELQERVMSVQGARNELMSREYLAEIYRRLRAHAIEVITAEEWQSRGDYPLRPDA
jgi:hypothetical protein